MSPQSRADVVSSFTIVKGAMIEETYAAFAAWDLDRPKRANLDRLKSENPIAAKSLTWLRDVAKVLNRRFDPDRRDRALVILAQRGMRLDEWKPLLLWHMTRDEFLVRDFLESWLFSAHEAGRLRILAEDIESYVRSARSRGGITEHAWSDTTTRRVAIGLLKIATDFGLLRGSASRQFASYHLPERSFLYLLHAIRDEKRGAGNILTAPDWRLYLMHPVDVERELLRLHQFKKLDYQVAGSLVQLSLPCRSPQEFAERLVA